MATDREGKIILGIETSCDETGVAILHVQNTNQGEQITVLANTLHSQIEIHKEYGGVFPALAKREHAKIFTPLFIEALSKANLLHTREYQTTIPNEKKEMLDTLLIREPELRDALTTFYEMYEDPHLDIITVTNGPGLEPALWVGINAALALGKLYDTSVYPANHMEGHIVSVFIPEKEKTFTFNESILHFPMLALLVSGGHTELVLIHAVGEYEVLGRTLDDAAGEAFDKVARMLDLPYPGGPEISQLAKQARNNTIEKQFTFPRPMLHDKTFNFSFSGLKTSVLYTIRDLKKPLTETQKMDIAREVEDAIVEVLIYKTLQAQEKYNTKAIIVAGGVSANTHLQNELDKKLKMISNDVPLFFPNKLLATDNALMIALAGYLKSKKNKKTSESIVASGNLNL